MPKHKTMTFARALHPDLESMRKPLAYDSIVSFIISCCFRQLSPTGVHVALVARIRIWRIGGGRENFSLPRFLVGHYIGYIALDVFFF